MAVLNFARSFWWSYPRETGEKQGNQGERKMSGMGDGYVGTAQDAVRIRKLEKQREAERRKIQELKDKSASAKGQPGLLQFGKSRGEVRIGNPTPSKPFRFLGFFSVSKSRISIV